MPLKLSRKRLIQPRKDPGRVRSTRGLSSKCSLEHGSDQCGRQTVAADIRDQNTDVLFVDQDEVVKVPRHGAHGDVASRDVQALDLGSLTGQNGQLNLPRHLKFAIYGYQLAGHSLVGL